MTTEPKASLGGGGAKRSAPVAWRVRRRNGHGRWSFFPDEPLADAKVWDAEDYEVQPLYAAPVLPVEVREKIARIISPDAFATRDRHYAEISALVEGGAVTEDQAADLRRSADMYPGRAFAKADAILSTITGDA